MRSNKQLAAYQRKKLIRMQRELIEMASEWEDRDNYIVSLLDEAKHALAETHKNIQVENEY